MDWLFDQAPNVATVTCRPVIEGAPILVVTHYLDDHSWAFLDGQVWDQSKALVVGMKTVIDAHPYIKELADLPPGWRAERASEEAPWIRTIDPPEYDNDA